MDSRNSIKSNHEQHFVDLSALAKQPWIGQIIPTLSTELGRLVAAQSNCPPESVCQAAHSKIIDSTAGDKEASKLDLSASASDCQQMKHVSGYIQLRQALKIADFSQAVLIVVDGLGYELLLEHLAYTPTIRGFRDEIHPIATCVPSTTAAALTAMTTGARPAQTRMVGYSVLRPDLQFSPNLRVRAGQVMNLLTFAPDMDAIKWQPQPTWFQRVSPGSAAVITSPRFQHSGMTKATLRGAKFIGRELLADRFAAGIQEVLAGRKITYIYWSEIDHTGHMAGPGSTKWLVALENFDRALGCFLREIPADVPVVLTADHGMIERRHVIDLRDTPELARGVYALAGEGRCVHIHLEPKNNSNLGGHRTSNLEEEIALVKRWQNYLGERALVVPRTDLAAYLGEGEGLNLVGAAIAFLSERDVVVDSRMQSAGMIAMKGVHGSLTPAEMLVPVVRLN